MPLKAIKRLLITGWCMLLYTNLYAQQDTLYLSLQQLFERGTEQHLQLAADRLKEKMANERAKTARTARLPELNVGLKGGFLGQPLTRLATELRHRFHSTHLPGRENPVYHPSS